MNALPRTITYLFVALALAWLTSLNDYAQSPLRGHGTLRLAELNCENLFDTIHDQGFNDHEFTPHGAKHWTSARYYKKLSSLSRQIAGLGQERPADLVALIEVENDTVVRDLTQRTQLRQLDYNYIVTHSQDPRGVDMALLYQQGSFRPIATHTLNWRQRRAINVDTRDALHVEGIIRSGDTIHLIVCHMPSRLGGKTAQKNRTSIARNLRQYADSIIAQRKQSNILIIGDFNDPPQSHTITRGMGAILYQNDTAPTLQNTRPNLLYNISFQRRGTNNSQGTYRYRGHWEMLDQCIVSGNLLIGDNPLRISPPRPANPRPQISA